MSLGSASNFFLGASSAGSGAVEGPIKSVRFNKTDSAHLNRTFGTATDTKKFTISFWVKRVEFTAATYLLAAGTGTQGYLLFDVGIIRFYGVNGDLKTNAVYRDPSAWYHIVAVADTANSTTNDRMQLYVNGVRLTDANGDFQTHTQPSINASLGDWNSASTHYVNRLGSGNYENFYMTDFYFIDGQAKEATDFGAFDNNGVWQAAAYSGTFGTNGFHLFDFANESGIGDDSSGNDNDWTVNNIEGPGNGTQYRTLELSENHASGSVAQKDKAFDATYIATYVNTSTWAITNTAWAGAYSAAYAELLWTPTGGYEVSSSLRVYYGCYDNTTKTTTLTITYTDASTETDSMTSGSNNWMKLYTASSAAGKTIQKIEMSPSTPSATNLQFGGFVIDDAIVESLNADTDVLFDVPTNGTQEDTGAGGELSANYCTWNPLAIKNGGATALQCVDGNLNFGDQGNTSSYGSCVGTIGVSSGKWYFEVTLASGSGVDTNVYVGILPTEEYQTNSSANAFNANNSALSIRGNGAAYRGDDSSTAGYATGVAIGKTLGFAFDVDAGTMTCFLDKTSLGTFPYSLAAGKTWVPFATDWSNAQPVSEYIINCGQRPFVATPPTDYKAICTANITSATIPNGSNNFEAKTFTGTGAEQVITGLEFQPDLTIFGIRDNSRSRLLFDSHRGATFYLQTNGASNPGQVEDATTLTSFNSDGFTVGSSADVNRSTSDIITWNWKAGSSSPNGDGTISSTVRANASAGFSIVTWTGTGSAGTVGHGLNATPKLVIAKVYDSGYTDNWPVYHSAYGATQYTYLNTNLRATTYSDFWNDTEPTSSVFSVGTANSDTTKNLIAYCFAPVAGYSSFGTFYSNASADNQFVYTGFKPRFVLIKAYDASSASLAEGGWGIRDSARQSYNPQGPSMSLNTNSIESTATSMDFLSNGIKFRDGFGGNRDILYLAFAENPFSANGGIAG